MNAKVMLTTIGIVAGGLGLIQLSSALATPIPGDTDCSFPPGSGADVIVGDIPTSVTNYTVGTNADGRVVDAFAVGTTSCNIGDEVLDWFPIPETNHPVISQNMYRLYDGRFEQVGQSWLKHGFGALQGSVCCECTGNGDFHHLGVGCSDPYGSGLNGSQSGLGPKFEVNVVTGGFPENPQDFNNTGNSVYKRLQVGIDDLDETTYPDANYFVEAQYVHVSDAANGNDLNNASWRKVQITQSESVVPDYNLSIASENETQREQPAIFAWKAADMAVNMQTIDVPDDGRFYVAWKATDLGGGQWGYEFAIHNFNSHRSAGGVDIGFLVPAAITNVGFHDVDYHSGEPVARLVDGLPNDWTNNIAGSSVFWTFPVPAGGFDDADTQANAIRWATMYNFRFQADQPPAQLDELTITLLRAGLPATVSLALEANPLENDACESAIELNNGVVGFSTADATTDGPDEPGCTATVKDVWFRYSAPGTGTVTATTCGSSFDTVLSVYEGCPGDGEAILVGCDDNGCNDGAGPGSRLVFPAVGGTEYWLRIGGAADARRGIVNAGDALIDLSFGLANDDCQTPVAISQALTAYSTAIATTDGPAHPESCTVSGDGGQTYHDIWYTYGPACDGLLTVSTCDDVHGAGAPTYDTDLVVYGPFDSADDIDCGDLPLLACNDDDSAHPCGTGPTWSSNIELLVEPGMTYLIRVGGWNNGSMGDGTLLVDCSCRGDVNLDGLVDLTDLLEVISQWGSVGPPRPSADIAPFPAGDNTVGLADLLLVITSWGGCG